MSKKNPIREFLAGISWTQAVVTAIITTVLLVAGLMMFGVPWEKPGAVPAAAPGARPLALATALVTPTTRPTADTTPIVPSSSNVAGGINCTASTALCVRDYAGRGIEIQKNATPVFSVAGASGNIVSAGNADVTGNLVVTGTISNSGMPSTLWQILPYNYAGIELGNGGIITATKSIEEIRSSGANPITVTLSADPAARYTAGTVFVFVNQSTEVINIAASAAFKTAATCVLGRYDSLTVFVASFASVYIPIACNTGGG